MNLKDDYICPCNARIVTGMVNHPSWAVIVRQFVKDHAKHGFRLEVKK